VLIDSMSPGGASASAPAPATPSVPPQTDPRFIDPWILARWILTLPARTGVARLVAGPLGMTLQLSPEEANAYTAFSVTTRHLETFIEEGKGMSEGLAQAGAVQSFGAMPLIVLSRGLVKDPNEEWQRQQSESLRLSSNSQQLFAERSGHNIHVDQPEAAVGAIVTMVEQLRRLSPR
jgi:hypothetical protein